MGLETLDYYAVLEIAPQASQDDIYSAYQKARTTYSLDNPDIFKIFSHSEALAWLEIIDEAYSVIGSPNSRRVYDHEKQSGGASTLPSLELSDDEEESAKLADEKPLPEGFGSTSISQFPILKAMEELIEKQEVFDGLFLKKVREYKKIELTDFSEHTCIAIRHLYAIENNNFSVLPAAVFVRGYIIQYCRILDLDQKKVVTSFMSLFSNDH